MTRKTSPTLLGLGLLTIFLGLNSQTVHADPAPSGSTPVSFGAMTSIVPAGWVREDRPEGVLLHPEQTTHASIFIPAPRNFPAWREYFQSIQQPGKGEEVVTQIPQAVRRGPTGFEEIYGGQVVKGTAGRQYFDWFAAGHKGRCLQTLYFRAEGHELYHQTKPALDEFIRNLRFQDPTTE